MEYVLLKQEAQSADTESPSSLFHRNITEVVRNGNHGSGSIVYLNSDILSRMQESFEHLLNLDNCKV